DLLRMLRPVTAAFSQLDDAEPANVGITLDLADPRTVAVNVVEHEPFSQSEIAERQVFGAESAHDRVEQNRSSDAEICPSRIHAGHVKAFLDVHFHRPFPQPMNRLRADALISDVLRRRSLLFRDRERTKTENGARCPDHAIETGLPDLVELRAHFLVEIFDEPPLIVRRERVSLDEPLGEADDARLEALTERQVGRSAEGHFAAPAADVDDDGGAASDVHPVSSSQVN